MSMTPEYQATLDALAQAADAMTRACNEYNQALAAPDAWADDLVELKETCEEARDAHDERLADAWELIEDQSSN